jgi:hypothetical protein
MIAYAPQTACGSKESDRLFPVSPHGESRGGRVPPTPPNIGGPPTRGLTPLVNPLLAVQKFKLCSPCAWHIVFTMYRYSQRLSRRRFLFERLSEWKATLFPDDSTPPSFASRVRDSASLFVTWSLDGVLPLSFSARPGELAAGQAFVWMDRHLDRTGAGPMYLRQPAIVQQLDHYELHAFVVMANHVHVLIHPHSSSRRSQPVTQVIKRRHRARGQQTPGENRKALPAEGALRPLGTRPCRIRAHQSIC